MDGDESGLSSYYHHQQQQQQQHQHHQQHHHHPSTTTQPPPTTTSNTNGVIFSDPHHHHHQQQQQLHHHQHNESISHHYTSSEPTLVFPQNTVTGTLPPPPVQQQQETVKRKRGRPRKYGTPETPQTTSTTTTTAATTATTSATAKKLSTSSPSPSPSQTLPSSSSSPRRKDPASISSQSSSKKNQLNALGNAGQNFVSHVITVAAGEDVAQKIMSFTQQRKRAVCILSASGSISNASLRQPATLGGNVTYEGRFEILSLSGSFLHNETDGASSRTGGLSVCLSGTDGKIIGGGVGGPLKAAGPVQVIIGSFVIDTNKETNVDQKFEISSSKLPPQVIGATFSSVVYHSPDSLGRTSGRVNNAHQNIGVNNFMIQSRGMHSMPSTDWRDSPSFTDQGACQSSEDGDDGHLQH